VMTCGPRLGAVCDARRAAACVSGRPPAGLGGEIVAVESPVAIAGTVRGGRRRVRLGREVESRFGRSSRRTGEVATAFGLSVEPRRVRLVGDAAVELGPGRIVAIVGPSGAGKSTALAGLAGAFPLACFVQQVRFPAEVAVIDRVAVGESMCQTLALMTSCGLGDANLWVRPYDVLSEGERFRARLARAISLVGRDPSVAPLLCDEFCSSLDPLAAKAVSFNLRKLTSRKKLSLVVSCLDDAVLADLQPDVVVRLGRCGAAEVEERAVRSGRAISFRRRLVVERGTRRDYDGFAAMHYRTTDEPGFVSKVFVLRERGGEVLGVVVYAHGPLGLAMRHEATDRRYATDPGAVNRDFRILRRLVIRPDVRGCGLGHFLVRKTLPLVGTKYVECLAAMGAYNPVFERAGMRRIGQYEVSRRCHFALASLAEAGVDPNARDFAQLIARRRRVRAVVAGVVHRWYSATTGGGEKRVARQSPALLAQLFRGLVANRPVYYLWERPRRWRKMPPVGTSGRRRRR